MKTYFAAFMLIALGFAAGYAYYASSLDLRFRESAIAQIKHDTEYTPRPFQLRITINGFSEAQIDEAMRDAFKALSYSRFPENMADGHRFGIAPAEVFVPSLWWTAESKVQHKDAKPDSSMAAVYTLVAPGLAKIGKSIDFATGVVMP